MEKSLLKDFMNAHAIVGDYIQSIYALILKKGYKSPEKCFQLATIVAAMNELANDDNEWYSIVFSTKHPMLSIPSDEILFGSVKINDVYYHITAKPVKDFCGPLFRIKGRDNFEKFIKKYGVDLYKAYNPNSNAVSLFD